MDPTLIVSITGLVTAVLGGVGTLYVALRNARQTDANTEQIKVTVKKSELDILRESMQSEITRLNHLIANLSEENVTLRLQVNSLSGQVNALEIQYEREHAYTERLKSYIEQLSRMLSLAGLTPPPMPGE